LNESDATWNNTTIVRGDMAAEVAKLKARSGGDLLVFGSARLAQGLAEHGLVDDYRLMVYPVILGGGKRLFADAGQMASLELVDSTAAGDGIVMLTYKAA
jgi:dihydrofolate reductase